jgi:propionyl-CoA carboxylase alpha chain
MPLIPSATLSQIEKTVSGIKRLLIANRGEIAVRVIRTCKDLGISSIAVFSEVDRGALHVRLADEAYSIGPAPAHASYLNMDAIVNVALSAEVDAIHPGYGFLSENPEFAARCSEAGIIFIGPPEAAIRAMGDKTEARKLMLAAGVPMAPGTTDAVASAREAAEAAKEIGFPILVKAAAGGGGKGMRVVRSEIELKSSLEAATREAKAAFGDGRVYIEKYLDRPKHVEIQVMADAHGQVVHLFERECSVQRRHQKVIEECPSPVVNTALRSVMGQAAIKAAAACGYVGAGTVEFLLDGQDFYFMEMNTRLQVEHPVTEMVTGVDLVAEQIRVAEGKPLSFRQEDLSISGHAIECRVYAEDPASGFLPDSGTIIRHAPPAGPGVRVDAGVDEGSEITTNYDPMISKVVSWGRTRAEAILRMQRALGEYRIAGLQTTIPFCRFVLAHPAFQDGTFSTHFVQEFFTPEVLQADPADRDFAAAVGAALAPRPRGSNGQSASEGAPEWSEWAVRRRRYGRRR